VIALKVAILSPLDDINTNTPLIAIPPDTEVNIDLYPEIKITDPETRSVPKVYLTHFIGILSGTYFQNRNRISLLFALNVFLEISRMCF
jgi:hypothetical protein